MPLTRINGHYHLHDIVQFFFCLKVLLVSLGQKSTLGTASVITRLSINHPFTSDKHAQKLTLFTSHNLSQVIEKRNHARFFLPRRTLFLTTRLLWLLIYRRRTPSFTPCSLASLNDDRVSQNERDTPPPLSNPTSLPGSNQIFAQLPPLHQFLLRTADIALSETIIRIMFNSCNLMSFFYYS